MSIKNIDNQIKIGERLKQFRLASGYKTVEFASICGISQGSLSGLENGKSYPSGETLVSLVLNTDIDLRWLLTGDSKEKRENISLPIFSEIGEWIQETSGNGNSDWFENQFIRCFSDFLRWREKKELRIIASSETPEKKIA